MAIPDNLSSARLRKSLSHHLSRIASFSTLYAAHFREGTRSNKLRLLGVIALDSFGAVSRGFVILLLASFVGAMQGEESKFAVFSSFAVENPSGSLFLTALLLLAIQLFSVWTAYYSVRQIRWLARSFHGEMIQGVFRTYIDAERQLEDESLFDRVAVQRLVMMGARQAGIALETIMRLFRPVLYCIVALAILFWIDWQLTLALLVAMLFITPLAYLASSTLQQDAREFYNDQAQDMGREMSSRLSNLEASSYWANSKSSSVRTLVDSPALDSFLDGFDRMKLSSDQMSFFVGIFSAILLSLMLLIFGYYASNSTSGWESALAYIGGVYFLGNGAQTGFAYLANLNRFYPQVRELETFLSLPESRLPAIDPDEKLELSYREKPDENSELLTLSVDGPLVLFSSTKLSRKSLGYFSHALARSSQNGAAFIYNADFVTGQKAIYSGILSDSLKELSNGSLSDLEFERFLQEMDIADDLEHAFGTTNPELRKDSLPTLPAAAKACVTLLPAIQSSKRVVFVDANLVANLSVEQRQKLKSSMKDKVIVLVSQTNQPYLEQFCEHAFLFFAGHFVGFYSIEKAFGLFQSSKEADTDPTKLTDDFLDTIDF